MYTCVDYKYYWNKYMSINVNISNDKDAGKTPTRSLANKHTQAIT